MSSGGSYQTVWLADPSWKFCFKLISLQSFRHRNPLKDKQASHRETKCLWGVFDVRVNPIFLYPKDYHPDRQDIQKSMTAFKNLSVSG